MLAAMIILILTGLLRGVRTHHALVLRECLDHVVVLNDTPERVGVTSPASRSGVPVDRRNRRIIPPAVDGGRALVGAGQAWRSRQADGRDGEGDRDLVHIAPD